MLRTPKGWTGPKEGEICGDVDLPQTSVELDAVEDVQGAHGGENHVLGPKVSMALADSARLGTRRELLSPTREKGGRKGFGGSQAILVDHSTRHGAKRRQVVLQGDSEAVECPALRRNDRRAGVEASDACRDRCDLRSVKGTPRRQGFQTPILLDGSHLDRALDRGRVVRQAQRVAVSPRDDPDDTEVDAGGARRRFSRTSSKHIRRRSCNVP
ncbi:MAG: hypothetical protein JJE35_01095 [Thermoleophilia bacterium]|nr:hypothetical protein [Thermoleophilia bacterium]